MTPNTHEFQEQMVAFVRSFGLHHPEVTPCGRPVSVSAAHALAELAREQPLRAARLAARLRLERSTVSRLIAHLEQQGWVRRERHPADGRSVLLSLTDDGERVAEQLAVARAARFAGIFTRIPPEQRAPVLHALQVVVAAAAEQPK